MDESAYRSSTPPSPRVFPLEMSPVAALGLLGAAVSIVIAIVVFVVAEGGLITVFLLGGPGLFYFFVGAPRSIEVHHDRVVVRYWLRRTKTHAAPELIVQQMPDELVLIDGNATYVIRADAFPGESFAECAGALSQVAGRFDVRRPRR
jgi:hypothetical protein